MESKGKVIAVCDLQSGETSRGKWQSQMFVIETLDEKFPKKQAFTLFGDKVKYIPRVGDMVEVKFDLSAREWNGKWFTDVNAYDVRIVNAEQSQAPQAPQAPNSSQEPFPPFPPTAEDVHHEGIEGIGQGEKGNDLPF